MKKSLIALIDSYDDSIISLGLKRIPVSLSGEIKFEGGGWVLVFMTDRYYFDGLVINLIDVGAKEYSLSILKEAVKEFESDSVAILREQSTDYPMFAEIRDDNLEGVEATLIDLIKFLVEKFTLIKKNQRKIDSIYDTLANKKLREIGLRFVGE